MSEHSTSRTLVAVFRREFQDHRGAFLWTPLGLALGLLLLLSVALVLVGRVADGSSVALSVITHDLLPDDWEKTFDGGPESAAPPDYTIERQTGPIDESQWNFSRDWRFTPLQEEGALADDSQGVQVGVDIGVEMDGVSTGLNPALYAVHTLFNWTLLAVLLSYLLGALFNDRRDGSILYWKSMPLPDTTDVIARLLMAAFVVPLVYLVISMVTQLLLAGLGLIASRQLGEDPIETVLGQLSFAPLFIGQISGWVLCALVMLPLFGWLLLVSAAARRSPFLLAVVPLAVLLLVDGLLVGSGTVWQFMLDHLPRAESVQLGELRVSGVSGRSLQPTVLVPGLLLAAVFIAGAVYLRKYRFEL